MGIDWVTFAAQLVNLAILAALLYKFLFKPLLGAIDAREAHIASEIKDAETLARLSRERLEELDAKHREIDASRQNILDQARLVADNLKVRLEREIRDDVLEQKRRLAEELEQERKGLESELREAVVSNFTRLARKAFCELADANFETRVAEVLKERFFALPAEERLRLKPVADEEGVLSPVTVRTAFDAGERTRKEISAMLKDALDIPETAIRFETDSKLLCGLEITSAGNVLAWNFEDYLRDFTETMGKTLQEMSMRLNREEN